MRSLLLLTLTLLALVSCGKRAENFPPDDTTVRLDSTNLPIVWIEVGGEHIDRDHRIAARMKVVDNGKGKLNYADTLRHPGQRIDYEGDIAVRYRGNSTYNDSPKKAYSLRTLEQPLHRCYNKQKVALLGMGKDDNWALLAPYSDKSMMRDLLAFEISRPWMEYVPEGRYCELFLDGTYYGVYILCEVVSRGKSRLHLDNPGQRGDELTGGYLLEVDCNDEKTYTSKYPPVKADGTPLTDRRIIIQYKHPDYDELSTAQLNYIHGRIDRMEQALAAGTGYENHLDVMSFIDYQIAMEMGHNVDGYRLSGKFYKRRDSTDPRFKMAVWDMNQAYGNTNRLEGWRTDTWIYQSNDLMYREGEVYLVPFWWQRLNSDPQYTARLKQRWAQYRSSTLDEERLMATVDSLANVLTACGAIDRNSQAWPRWGVWVWPNKYVAQSFDDEVSYLKQWLHDRLAWMDQQLNYNE